MKIKRGTIFQNLWAGYKTYFVYDGLGITLGQNKTVKGYKLVYLNNDWEVSYEQSCFYRRDIENDREHFPIVGYFELGSISTYIKDSVLSAVSGIHS